MMVGLEIALYCVHHGRLRNTKQKLLWIKAELSRDYRTGCMARPSSTLLVATNVSTPEGTEILQIHGGEVDRFLMSLIEI